MFNGRLRTGLHVRKTVFAVIVGGRVVIVVAFGAKV